MILKALSDSAFNLMRICTCHYLETLMNFISNRWLLSAASISVAALVAACGGSSTPPPVAQATLVAVATPSSFLTSGSSTLSTTGGSGSGAVTYTVASGPCTLSGTTLSATAAGTCSVTAQKAADNSYLVATSSPVSVTVTAPAPVISLATGFNDGGVTTNGGTWANGASWGAFTFASGTPAVTGFGGGGWQQNPPLTTGGYVYFGEYTTGQITGGYLDLYFTTPSPVTINGQTSIKIPLAISEKWATQTNNKTINVILTNAWNSSRNCNDAVSVSLSDVTKDLTVRTIPLSSFTAVASNACDATKTAAQILATPITSVHVQTSGTNFNTTVVDTGTSNYATGFTIGSPVTLQ
jgi:hypothetical protein